jgi:hypothetical protein
MNETNSHQLNPKIDYGENNVCVKTPWLSATNIYQVAKCLKN